MTNQLPDGLVPGGTSPVFTQHTLPDALQAEHTLASGHWAVLHVLEGSLRFVNLETGKEQLISAPDRVTIRPGLPHRVALEGPLRCRIDFYREPQAGSFDEEARMTTLIERAREWGKERDQRWLERGRFEGQRDLVIRMVTQRFGPGAADDLAPVLTRVSNPDRIAAIAARVSECETAEELVVWAQGA